MHTWSSDRALQTLLLSTIPGCPALCVMKQSCHNYKSTLFNLSRLILVSKQKTNWFAQSCLVKWGCTVHFHVQISSQYNADAMSVTRKIFRLSNYIPDVKFFDNLHCNWLDAGKHWWHNAGIEIKPIPVSPDARDAALARASYCNLGLPCKVLLSL